MGTLHFYWSPEIQNYEAHLLDRVEDLRVARELSGGVHDEDVSPKKKELEGKKYLDPIKEHVPWNPMVVKDEEGRAGWEVVQEE